MEQCTVTVHCLIFLGGNSVIINIQIANPLQTRGVPNFTLQEPERTPVRKYETGNDISVNMHYDRQTDIGTQTRIHTYAFAYVYLCPFVSVSVSLLGKHETFLCH